MPAKNRSDRQKVRAQTGPAQRQNHTESDAEKQIIKPIENQRSIIGERENSQRDEAFVNCLAYFCQVFSKPFDREKAFSGLPIGDKSITSRLFIEAASNLELYAVEREGKIAKTPALFAPFIAFDRDQTPFIVDQIEPRKKRARIILFSEKQRISKTIGLKDLSHLSSEKMILLSPTEDPFDDPLPDTAAARVLSNKILSDIFSSYWPSWLLVIISAACINILGLATPLFIMNVYDRVLPNLAIPTLWALTGGVVLALLFDAILKQLRGLLLDRTGHRIDMRVGAYLFGHVLSIRSDHFPKGTGGLANTVREFDTVRDFFTSASLVALTDFIFIGIFLAVLWLIAGPIIYVPIAALILIIVLTLMFRGPLSRAIRSSIGSVSERQTLLVESLSGLDAIRASNAEGKRRRALERAVIASANGTSRAKLWSSFSSNLTGFMLQAVTVVIIVWGVHLVLEGELTVGGLIAANILAGRALAPVSNIVQTLSRSGQALQSLQRISALLGMPREDENTVSGLEIRKAAIEFKDVEFSYPRAQTPSLSNISLMIEPGDRIGLIGSIGSGKSTLGKLLSGFYDPTKGQLLVDNIDIRQFPRPSLRNTIAYSGQEPILFSGTIRENIALGSLRPTDQQIHDAAEVAGVLDFSNTLVLGLDTAVEERGQNFSGGQRQAIALARNLLRKPKILFLDEPTSSMDGKAEVKFIERLRRFCGKEITLIIATHKANMLSLVDKLVVLEEGEMVARGPKDDVLKKLKSQANALNRNKPVRRTDKDAP